MIYQATIDLKDLLETGDGGTITDLNTNIGTVDTDRGTTTPTVKAFYDFDMPTTIIERDMPLVFVRPPIVRSEDALQGRRYSLMDFEIGCIVNHYDSEQWRLHSAIIAEALALTLDEVRGQDGFIKPEPNRYNFVFSGWGRPNEQAATYGGFIATQTWLYHENLS